jgi:hypothetical protein
MKDTLKAELTSPWVQEFIRKRGSELNVSRLVRHLLSNPRLNDPQTVWAYDRLKPDLVAYECEAEGFKKATWTRRKSSPMWCCARASRCATTRAPRCTAR